jgi:hypothetical protein
MQWTDDVYPPIVQKAIVKRLGLILSEDFSKCWQIFGIYHNFFSPFWVSLYSCGANNSHLSLLSKLEASLSNDYHIPILLGIGLQNQYCTAKNKISKSMNKLYEEQAKNNSILK